MKNPVRVAVTGAAGNIGYALLFRLAAGDFLGPDQPIVLQLLEVEPVIALLKGVAMELEDGAFPLLQEVIATTNPEVAFKDADYVFLLGSRPRDKNITERRDLLLVNAEIFAPQGRALNDYAARGVKVLTVANPANTNALIAQNWAPDLSPTQFSAMTRLDHNRARYQLAAHTQQPLTAVKKLSIWGNHSGAQFPDLNHAEVAGQPALASVARDWYEQDFIPTVQQRGMAIIQARGGRSSAASAANAALDHMRNWALGTPEDDWVSMAVPADGSYGIAEGIVFSFPCRCKNGRYEIVQGLEIDDFARAFLNQNDAALREERDAIAHLLRA